MINDAKQQLIEKLEVENSNEAKKRVIINTLYEWMKNEETLYQEGLAIADEMWETFTKEELAQHVVIQLENEYRQAVRNFNKNLERIQFQRKGKQIKEELLAELEELKGNDDWKQLTKMIYELKDEWEDAPYAGEFDGTLSRQFRSLCNEILDAKDQYFIDMDANRRSARQVKQDLVKAAQEASTSTRWKETSRKMKELMDDWKQAGYSGKEDNDVLWEQFNSARQAFFKNQDEYFVSMREKHEESAIKKAALIEEAIAIQNDENFKETSEKMRILMNEWKKAGSAGKDKEDILWNEFSQAREVFYDRQNEYFEKRKGKYLDNLYEGIKRKNKQIADLEGSSQDLQAKISEIRNMEPVLMSNEDRWEITNERNQEIARYQELLDENSKKIKVLRDQLNEMDGKYKELED